MVESRLASPISSLNDAIRLGYKVCAHRSDSGLVVLNGVSESNVVELASRGDVLPSVGSTCDVAVLRQEDFEASQAVNRGSFCELAKIGDPITTGLIGIAVSEKWAWALRYAMTAMQQEGQVQEALNAYRPPDYCSAVAAEAEATAEPPSLQVEGMAGPFVLTSIIALFGFIVHFIKAAIDDRRARRQAKAKTAVAVDDGDAKDPKP